MLCIEFRTRQAFGEKLLRFFAPLRMTGGGGDGFVAARAIGVPDVNGPRRSKKRVEALR